MSEIPPVSPVATTYSKEYKTQEVSKIDDNKHKVTDSIYNVITYDRGGRLDVFTTVRYLDYMV
jgi:hypothetical protein